MKLFVFNEKESYLFTYLTFALTILIISSFCPMPKVENSFFPSQELIIQSLYAEPEPHADEENPYFDKHTKQIWSQRSFQDHLYNLQNNIDWQFAKKLAESSVNVSKRRTNGGHCLRWVRIAYNKARQKLDPGYKEYFNLNLVGYDKGRTRKNYFPALSADLFMKWAHDNPKTLCKKMHLADITNIKELHQEVGVIYIYKRARCGFHKKYGHIEILTQNKPAIACSDHCRRLSSCKPDMVLAPVKSCNWQCFFKRKQQS